MTRKIFLLMVVVISLLTLSCPDNALALWAKRFDSGWNDMGGIWLAEDGGYYLWASTTDTAETGKQYLLFSKLNSSGAVQWTKKIYLKDNDSLFIMPLEDGGFFVHGETESDSGDQNILWAKFDNSLDQVYGKVFGGLRDESIGFKPTDDGGMIGTGLSNSYGSDENDKDMLVIKINSSGNIQWSKVFDHGIEDASPMLLEINSGYMLCSSVANTSSGGKDILVSKLDSSGNPQWVKLYGGTGINGATIHQISGGNYLLWGTIKPDQITFDTDIILIKMDGSGNILWGKKYASSIEGKQGADVVNYVTENPDGTFLLNGTITDTTTLSSDILLMKLDSSGNISWKKTLGGTGYDVAGLQKTSDGNYLLSGSSTSFSSGPSDYDVLFAKLDSLDPIHFVWQRTFGDTGADMAGVVEFENKYIVTGTTSSFGASTANMDVFGVILNSDGDYPGCHINDITLTEDVPSITISDLNWTPVGTSLVERIAGTASDITLTVESATLNENDICDPIVDVERMLTVNINPSGGGTVTGAGINCPGNCSGTYDNNAGVTLTANANTGYTFTGWTGACSGTGTCTVTMDDDKAVTATFTSTQTFTISATASSGGSISPSGNQTVNYGDSLTFSITPNEGYEVTDVKVNGKSEGAITEYTFDEVTANQKIAATFKAKTFTITATAGTGGKITPKTGTVKGGTKKTFSIKPDKGYHLSEVKLDEAFIFDGTNISDSNLTRSGNSNVYKYNFENIADDHSIEAIFEIDTFLLSVSKTGTGTGTLTSDVTGIGCGDDCDEIYDYNTTVIMTALEDDDSIFEGWSGSCKGNKLTCKVKMINPASATAKFTKTYKLTVNKEGTGDGTVTSSPAGIKCGTDCEEKYKDNAVVKLTAKPTKDSAFISWSGCTTVSGTKCTVQIGQDTPVTATFELKSVQQVQQAKDLVQDMRDTIRSVYNYSCDGCVFYSGEPGILETPFQRLSEEITKEIEPELTDTVDRIGWIIESAGGVQPGETEFFTRDPYTLTITIGADETSANFTVEEGTTQVDSGNLTLTKTGDLITSGTFTANMKTASGTLVANLNYSSTVSSGTYKNMIFSGSMTAPGISMDFSEDGRKLYAVFTKIPGGGPQDIYPKSIILSGKIMTTTVQLDGEMNIPSIVWNSKSDIFLPKSATFDGSFEELKDGSPTGVRFTGKITGSWSNASSYDTNIGETSNNYPKWNASFDGKIEAPSRPTITAFIKVTQTAYKKYSLEFNYHRVDTDGAEVFLKTQNKVTFDGATEQFTATLSTQDGLKVNIYFDDSKPNDQKFTGTITTSSGTELAELYTLNGMPMVMYVDDYFESIF